MARASRAHISAIVIEYTDIDEEQLWAPGHMIYDWAADITITLEKFTKATAPGFPGTSHAKWPRRSTGNLRKGIVAFGRRTGPESYTIDLISQAPYTMYVHGGTRVGKGGTYIYSTMGLANRGFIDANIGTWKEGDLIQSGPNMGERSGEGIQGILPISGKMFMVLPPGAGFTNKFHLRVKGQLPNAFLFRGWDRTNEEHRNELGAMTDRPLGFLTPKGVGKGPPIG